MENYNQDIGHKEQKEEDPPQYSAHKTVEIQMNTPDNKCLSSRQAQEPLIQQPVIGHTIDVTNNPQQKVPNELVNIDLKN